MEKLINKLTQKPSETVDLSEKGRFEIYNLSENPFPSTPFVNKASTEDKINGNIFEIAVRENEFKKIKTYFLNVPQSNPDHLRLGFINDTSYIGRGNGKSAFLINLLKIINENYCLDLSEKKNKCFGIFAAPEGSGKIKTFDKFVDLIFDSILESDIINVSLAMIRLDILTKKTEINKILSTHKFDELVNNLNSDKWFRDNKIDFYELNTEIKKNKYLKNLPSDFPLYNKQGLFPDLTNQKSFIEYYNKLKKDIEKNDFVFTFLIDLFLAAGFNGAYILVDDFERIPEFQSAIQKKDFATQLRTILFDGMYMNSKIGFYNFLLALHAGVPRLLETAWSESGMESRVPLNPQIHSNNIIAFEKLNEKHAIMMIKKYLEHYRIKPSKKNDELFPFTEKSIKQMSEFAEYNASAILKFAHQVIDRASSEKIETIDEDFIRNYKNRSKDFIIEASPKNITTTKTIDLKKKAKTKKK
jgi:hypothetical protein